MACLGYIVLIYYFFLNLYLFIYKESRSNSSQKSCTLPNAFNLMFFVESFILEYHHHSLFFFVPYLFCIHFDSI